LKPSASDNGYGVESEPATVSTVIKIVADHLGMPAWRLEPSMRIVEDLGADSLDFVELVMTIEERFHLTIPQEVISEISTLNDLAVQIDALREKNYAPNVKTKRGAK
jgi:acyl carrier protein